MPIVPAVVAACLAACSMTQLLCGPDRCLPIQLRSAYALPTICLLSGYSLPALWLLSAYFVATRWLLSAYVLYAQRITRQPSGSYHADHTMPGSRERCRSDARTCAQVVTSVLADNAADQFMRESAVSEKAHLTETLFRVAGDATKAPLPERSGALFLTLLETG